MVQQRRARHGRFHDRKVDGNLGRVLQRNFDILSLKFSSEKPGVQDVGEFFALSFTLLPSLSQRVERGEKNMARVTDIDITSY